MEIEAIFNMFLYHVFRFVGSRGACKSWCSRRTKDLNRHIVLDGVLVRCLLIMGNNLGFGL